MYFRFTNEYDIYKVESPYSFIKKQEVFLIRHGLSCGNLLEDEVTLEGKEPTEEERLADSRWPLTDKGIEQAKDLGNRLNDFIWYGHYDKSKTLVLVSPYERVRQTYEIVNDIVHFDDQHVYVLDSIREQNYGAYDFRSKKYREEHFPFTMQEKERNAKYYTNYPLGESLAEISDRENHVLFFIKDYMEQYDIKQTIIFGHANANRILTMKMLNLPPEYFAEFKCPDNCSITSIKNGRYNGIVGI